MIEPSAMIEPSVVDSADRFTLKRRLEGGGPAF